MAAMSTTVGPIRVSTWPTYCADQSAAYWRQWDDAS
jgi:hypothetical protein